jgi:hypothetical protein
VNLPKLPGDWEWINEDVPPPDEPTQTHAQAQKQVGSILRTVAGPPKPEETPTFLKDFLAPTAKTAVETFVPTDPVGIGLLLASTVLTGGSAPAVRIMGRVAGEMAPVAESLGSSALRRIAGMAGAGAASAGLSGGSPIAGAFQGLLTQIGGEGITKLTQWTRMNAQARQLAQEDPETLGKIVTGIIPSIGSMRSARDFHAAFKKGAAQSAISDAYQTGIGELSQALQGKPIPSTALTSIRTAAKTAQMGATNPLLGGIQQPASHSFDDMVETIRRLRYQGWNEDEIARGMSARDAREAADLVEKDLLQGLPPPLAEKYQEVNSSYSRGKRLIDFFDDKNLLKENGDLNIPKLQQKIKSEGYSVRDSYQMAADAADLEQELFRGATDLGEDIPSKPGQLLPRVHLGGGATFLPHLPKLGKFAGRKPAGMTPFQGSAGAQLIRNYLNPKEPDRPISFRTGDSDSKP